MEPQFTVITPIELTLRDRLREETAAIHQSLHHNAGLQKLTCDNCSLADYEKVLSLFFHFYCEVDDFFSFIPSAQRFTHEARPLQWLEKDFCGLNKPMPARSAFSIANVNIAPFIPSIETYIGYLYVKQGSTLGGQTISKHLKKSLSLEPGVNQFFFNGFGDQTGACWKKFLAYLAHHETALDTERVVKSAHTYFAILDQLSSQYFPEEM